MDISKPLTVTGVPQLSPGTQDAPVITSPAGGMVATTTDVYHSTPLAAQIWVHGTPGPVNISNLTVDGANNGATGCTFNPVGILYENASGTVAHVATRNHIIEPYSTYGGCQAGYGIFVQESTAGTSTVAVNNSTVHNFQKNGIVAQQAGSTLTATGNTVLGLGPTTGAAQNGIEIAFGATGKITGNSVSDFDYSPNSAYASGILLFDAKLVTVTSSTVANAQVGIGIAESGSGNGDSNVVTGNKVYGSHVFDGIDVCSDSNTVKSNTVNGSDQSGIHNDSACFIGQTGNTGNIITNNIINEACAGLLTGGTPGSNLLSPNTFFNVVNTVVPGDTCGTPVFSSFARTGGGKSTRVQP